MKVFLKCNKFISKKKLFEIFETFRSNSYWLRLERGRIEQIAMR